MWVPGAMISGLILPSPPAEFTGPRLENEITSFALSAPVLAMPQPSVPVILTFSPAPTVRTFFAGPGVLTVLAFGPALPAANWIGSWCDPAVVCESLTIASYICAFVSYVGIGLPAPSVKPHELLDTLAPCPKAVLSHAVGVAAVPPKIA